MNVSCLRELHALSIILPDIKSLFCWVVGSSKIGNSEVIEAKGAGEVSIVKVSSIKDDKFLKVSIKAFD